MSVFSNPASRSTEQASAYVGAVLDLLGERDPMEVLRRTPEEMARLRVGLSREQVMTPEAPGKWSVRHVLQHLADSELVWGFRMRMVLGHDRPPLTGFDQDLWAERLRYDDADPDEASEEFTALRAMNLRLLNRMPRSDLSRSGIHSERGEESLQHMIRLYAGHDLLHLRQVERIRGAVAP